MGEAGGREEDRRMIRKRIMAWTCGECGRGYSSLADAQAHEAVCRGREKSQALPRPVVRYRWGWRERALVPIVVEDEQ